MPRREQYSKTPRARSGEQGNGQGRPRTGLPAAPRALEPGVALSEAAISTSVPRDDAGVPSGLAPGGPIPSTSGNRRPQINPAVACGSSSSPAARRRWKTPPVAWWWTRRVVGSASARSSRMTRTSAQSSTTICRRRALDASPLPPRTRRAAPRDVVMVLRRGADVVSFASRSPRVTAGGPGRMSRASAAGHSPISRPTRPPPAARRHLAELDAEADRARRCAHDNREYARRPHRPRKESRRRDDAARRRETPRTFKTTTPTGSRAAATARDQVKPRR